MGQRRTFGIIAHWIAPKSRAFGHGTFSCVATLRFRQRRPLCGSATLAFATSFVGRVASARNRARIEMYLSACDCTGFCANLQKPEIIQLPLSASAQARALPTHPPAPRRERARRRDRGIAVIRPRLRRTLRASTRTSNNREDRSSTRRESGTLRVLIVPTRSVWG